MKMFTSRLSLLHSVLVAFWFAAVVPSRGATLDLSPNTINDSYAGTLTMEISGLVAGETVQIEHFADFKSNDAVDAEDLLLQYYTLTDAQAVIVGGVTNLHTPGDLGTTPGAITARFEMKATFFDQRFLGKHLYRLSSPTGRFTPVVANLTVNNTAYLAQLSGFVQSAGTNVPYAGVVLLRREEDGDMDPVLGASTDGTGHYSLLAPPGTYLLLGFRSNYVAEFASSPVVTLSAGSKLTANGVLEAATRTLSGRVSDAADVARGLGGVLLTAESEEGKFSLAYTDQGGNFTLPVLAGVWEIYPDESGLRFLNYVARGQGTIADTTSGNANGLGILVKKATALIYGTVRNESGQGLPSVRLWAGSRDDSYEVSPSTDQYGHYFMPVRAGAWHPGVDNKNSDYADYLFTRPPNDTLISDGQSILQDFTGKVATYKISGLVRNTTGMPISGVGVYCSAEIGGANYNAYTVTDDQGGYSLPAVNGQWWVGVSCEGDQGVGQQGYRCPTSQQITMSGSNASADFSLQSCNGVTITTTSLPEAHQGAGYSVQLFAESCTSQTISWSVSPGSSLPNGLNLQPTGFLAGTPTQMGTISFSLRASDGSDTMDKSFSLTITPGDVVRPTLTVPGFSSGQFQFTINGATGASYTIQFSTDLATWTHVGTTTAPGPSFLYRHEAPAGKSGFYRVVAGP
jgi:hypothetical protein